MMSAGDESNAVLPIIKKKIKNVEKETLTMITLKMMITIMYC